MGITQRYRSDSNSTGWKVWMLIQHGSDTMHVCRISPNVVYLLYCWVNKLAWWWWWCLQNLIECGCTPGSWQIRPWRHIQLSSTIICNPLSQFLGKKLLQGMAATVHVLNRRMLPRLISSLSRHAEMLLLQEHNIKTWGRVMSLTKQIISISNI